MRQYPTEVEDYTNAFLVTAALILFMAFFTIAAAAGTMWMLLSAALFDTVLRWREARLHSSAED